MITINLNTHQLLDSFKDISQLFEGNIESTKNYHKISFSNSFGKGKIKAITLPNLTTYLEFEVKFNQGIYLNKVAQGDSIFFTYCSKGGLLCKDEFYNERILKEYTSSVYSFDKTGNVQIGFAKNKSYKFSIVAINQNLNGSLYERINNIFSTSDSNHGFLHLSSYNLKIAHCIEQINQLQKSDLVNSLMLQSHINKILAMSIKHLQEEINIDEDSQTSNLSNNELNKIKDIVNNIKSNPGERYTIASLCRETALSPSKLQEGFKLYNNTTVNEYIRNVRLEKAEDLIINKDLTISEVAYTIGINSRSYFSKIFKEKFNFSPKTYQDRFARYTNISNQLQQSFQIQ